MRELPEHDSFSQGIQGGIRGSQLPAGPLVHGPLRDQFLGQLGDLGLLGRVLRPTPARSRLLEAARIERGPPFLDMGIVEPFAA